MTIWHIVLWVGLGVLVLGAWGISWLDRRANRRLGEDAKKMLQDLNKEDINGNES